MLLTPIPTHPNQLKAFAHSLLGQLEQKDQQLAAQHHEAVANRRQLEEQYQCLLEQERIIGERNRELAARIEELKNANALAEKFKFELARYQRWRFGKKSEALGTDQIALWEAELDADIEALQKRLDDLQAGMQNQENDKDKDKDKKSGEKPNEKRKPKREALPETLPRFEVRLEPASTTCGCGAPMSRIGEDTAESLQSIPIRFWVKRTVRGKWACRCCETIRMAPAPAAPIDKAIAGTSVIAQVIVSKYVDHLPLHRQEGIYARMGVAIPRSTMAGWIGKIGVLFEPLTDLLAQRVLGFNALQADETPVPVLEPGSGKTATGYLWVYRTLPSDPVQAVTFDFAMSRGQAHPNRMLAHFTGTLQVDGYAGYNLILARPNVIEAGCLAHARRKFVDVYEATKSPVAQQAIVRIAALYQIEREFDETPQAGCTLDRARYRQARAGPLLEAFRAWLTASYAKLPPRSALAKAMKYTLNRWAALTRYIEDGRLPLDTNAIENAIRPVALGRRNWLFAGSETGGQRAAQMYSLISTAKLNGIEPLAYLTDILERLPTARMKDLEAMLPWNWTAQSAVIDIAAELAKPPTPLVLTAI